MRAAVIAQREMGWRLGLALIPHPQPFSLREKGVNLPSPLGSGAGGEGCSPLPPCQEGCQGLDFLPSPCPGRGAGVRAASLSRPERGAGGEGLLPSPVLGEEPGVRAAPLSRPERGSGGEGLLPSPALGEGPGVRDLFFPRRRGSLTVI